MKKVLIATTIIASLAILLVHCKEEEKTTPTTTTTGGTTATTATTATTSSTATTSTTGQIPENSVSVGTVNTPMALVSCNIEDGQYIVTGLQNINAPNGLSVGMIFSTTPTAGTYTIKPVSDTTAIAATECSFGVSDIAANKAYSATSGQVIVTIVNNKVKVTATNVAAVDNLSGANTTLSAKLSCN